MTKQQKDTAIEQNSLWLISANELLSGDVIYLTSTGDWSRSLSDALCVDDKSAVASKVQQLEAEQNRVLGPILVEARVNPDGTLALQHFRDRFRESGPTHRSDLPRTGHTLRISEQ